MGHGIKMYIGFYLIGFIQKSRCFRDCVYKRLKQKRVILIYIRYIINSILLNRNRIIYWKVKQNSKYFYLLIIIDELSLTATILICQSSKLASLKLLNQHALTRNGKERQYMATMV